MEEDDVLAPAKPDSGMAIVIVLLAIVVLLPPTLVLATLAFQWQRQALDYRDTISQEFVAEAALAEAHNRIAAEELRLAPNEGTSFLVDVDGLRASARVARHDDVVLTLDGRILEGAAADAADLQLTGVDAEGRVVYQYREIELYLVQVDVSRRPTLPSVRLYGVLGKLPDDSIQTLGTTIHRGYFDGSTGNGTSASSGTRRGRSLGSR